MTHPIYSQTTLEALSTAQVKDIAKSIGAIPDGDKRVKQTWISAVIDHQTKFSPAKVAAMEAHIETVMSRLETTEELPITPIEVPMNPIEVHIETIDSYIPTPHTHVDDVTFANAMGLTYDDVFGEHNPILKPIEETTITPIGKTQTPTPILIPILVTVLVLFFSIAIIPALIIGSIAIAFGHPPVTTPSQPIGSTA